MPNWAEVTYACITNDEKEAKNLYNAIHVILLQRATLEDCGSDALLSNLLAMRINSVAVERLPTTIMRRLTVSM